MSKKTYKYLQILDIKNIEVMLFQIYLKNTYFVFNGFIEQLQVRFNNHKKIIFLLYKLLPNKYEIKSNDCKMYSEFFDLEVLSTEIKL